MKKRGLVVLLLILFVILLTTGCWNRKELDRLAIVAAVGIDKGEDQKIKLTVQLIKPGALQSPSSEGGSGKEKGVWIIKSSGDTVFDAGKNFMEKSGRELFWPHTIVIIIGEEMAKDGLLPVINWFIRDHEMRLKTWVLVTQGEASEIIEGNTGLEKIPANHLKQIIESDALSKSVTVNLMDVSNMIISQSSHPVIGKIVKNKSSQDDEEEVLMKGAGVFRKDRLIGWLNPLETRGYLWIKDKVKSGIIIIPSPEDPDKLLSLEVVRSKGKIKPRLEMGVLKYTIEVDVHSYLGEQMSTEDLANPEMFTVLEDEQRQAVEKEIVALIHKAQEEYKLDILGLGEAAMREFPKEWNKVKERWDEEFPQAEIEVKVTSRLWRTGMLKRLKPE